MATATLTITLCEAEALHMYVRQHDRLGWEHDKEQQRRLHAALAALRDQGPEATADLECDEEWLWFVDRQVPLPHSVGARQVGRELLAKVQDALRALAEPQSALLAGPIPPSFAQWGEEEEAARSEWAARQGAEENP